MPALKNLRHEAFCQNIVTAPMTGRSNAECYKHAGYHTDGNAAEAGASRLLSSAKIQQRIAQLTAPAVRKTRTTVDSLASQFDAVFDGAMGATQFGAAGSAAAAKAKLFGFMREKLEIGGVGDFEKCETVDQVVDRLLDDTTPAVAMELLDRIRERIEARAADRAVVVLEGAAEPQAFGEAAQSLRALQRMPDGKAKR